MALAMADAPRVCPHCEAEVTEEETYCNECGYPLEEVEVDLNARR